MIDRYAAIRNYLTHLTEVEKLNICVNDFVGFLTSDKQLFEVMQPYMIHKCPYCMQIKSDRKAWDRCLKMKRAIVMKCERIKEPFFGMCYGGIEEYIVPILCKDVVIGFICVGEFANQSRTLHRIRQMYPTDVTCQKLLSEKLALSVNENKFDLTMITNMLGILSESIAALYNGLESIHDSALVRDSKCFTNETYTIFHAVEFIKQNFTEKITVYDIADFCCCSPSYISHNFKKYMKVNIKAYMNRLRVERAKTLLLNSNASITEIGLDVGFSDPNYFSYIFTNICGLPPTHFKLRYGRVCPPGKKE